MNASLVFQTARPAAHLTDVVDSFWMLANPTSAEKPVVVVPDGRFDQLRAGNLFPEQPFTDQSHFIHDVKKFAGVSPKELARNTNDRFIQFSTLPPT